jgi:hypothetical protein
MHAVEIEKNLACFEGPETSSCSSISRQHHNACFRDVEILFFASAFGSHDDISNAIVEGLIVTRAPSPLSLQSASVPKGL